jgi:hypothetical protein
MNNKDLIKQYLNTGAILTRHQIETMSESGKQTYFRRRLVQYSQSHYYRFHDYEIELVPDNLRFELLKATYLSSGDLDYDEYNLLDMKKKIEILKIPRDLDQDFMMRLSRRLLDIHIDSHIEHRVDRTFHSMFFRFFTPEQMQRHFINLNTKGTQYAVHYFEDEVARTIYDKMMYNQGQRDVISLFLIKNGVNIRTLKYLSDDVHRVFFDYVIKNKTYHKLNRVDVGLMTDEEKNRLVASAVEGFRNGICTSFDIIMDGEGFDEDAILRFIKEKSLTEKCDLVTEELKRLTPEEQHEYVIRKSRIGRLQKHVFERLSPELQIQAITELKANGHNIKHHLHRAHAMVRKAFINNLRNG